MNKATHSNSILLGENLRSKSDYHLLVNRNNIKIDKVMTHEEWEIIHAFLMCIAFWGVLSGNKRMLVD